MNVFRSLLMIVKANRSAILLASGIAMGVGCVVTTAVQTVKASDIIVDANEKMDNLNIETEDGKKEERAIRKSTNLKIAKTYIVPACLGIGSIVCILGAYKIVSSQRAAAIASLSAVSSAFEKYRNRVIDKYGVEEDYNLYNGIDTVEVKDVETGEKRIVVTSDPIDASCYSKLYSYETSSEWKANPKANIEMLRFYQRYWNEQLRIKGYVTYNEVIESLGFSRKVGDDMTDEFIPNGIGWVSSENVPDELLGQIDTFISFVPKSDELLLDRKVNAIYEDAYILNFNCYPIDNLLMKKTQNVKKGKH